MSLGRVAILTILAVPVYEHRMSFFPCRRSASPVSREMQVKNHSEMSHLLEWLLPRRSTKCCWGCGGEGTLVHCWWELRRPLWKQYGGSSKLQNIWSFDPYPAIPLLGVYLKEMRWPSWIDILTFKVIDALSPRAKTWKQPKCMEDNTITNK